MFLRFVVHNHHEVSGRREGLFQALGELRHSGVLSAAEQERYDQIHDWFKGHLKRPRSLTRSSKPHAKHVALSWFKHTATEHIAKMYELVHILDAHGVAVDVLRSERPGYVVYEDHFQVAAEPFRETVG